MTFKVTIKEISKQVVEVEADSYEDALKKVEADYWNDPNSYVLEAEETIVE